MKFIGNLLAGISSAIFFIILLVMAGVLVLSNVFSANYYTNVLDDINITELKLSDLGITDLEKDVTVEEILVDALSEAGVSEANAQKILNSKKINQVAGEMISEAVIYLVDQKEVPQLNVKDVETILESEEMSGIVDNVPRDMTAEEITNELNKMIRELLEGEVNYAE